MLTVFPRLFQLSPDGERRPAVLVKTSPYNARKQASALVTLAALTKQLIAKLDRKQNEPTRWKVMVQTEISWTLGAVALIADVPGREEEGLKIMIAACDEYVRRRRLAQPHDETVRDPDLVVSGG
jgi:hypothetical protein